MYSGSLSAGKCIFLLSRFFYGALLCITARLVVQSLENLEPVFYSLLCFPSSNIDISKARRICSRYFTDFLVHFNIHSVKTVEMCAHTVVRLIVRLTDRHVSDVAVPGKT